MRQSIHALFVLSIILYSCQPKTQAPKADDDENKYWQAVTRERKAAGLDTNDIQEKIWYKNSFIYSLDTKTFQDSDGDGVGDFKGLTSRLDYIQSLGADIIWLAPMHPSPGKDDGYDITDFYSVDKRLGTINDLKECIAAARQRNIHVVADLVFNHTSDKHPWFVMARKGVQPWESWYTWSKGQPENQHEGMVFEGPQKEIWTWEKNRNAYYYHRFYDYMPDLNIQNPSVRAEMQKVMAFWLQSGLAGFRVDAASNLAEIPKATGSADFEQDGTLFTDMRTWTTAASPTNILVGEAAGAEDKKDLFFGKHGENLNMIFSFYITQCLFYAMASQNKELLEKALKQNATLPKQSSWVYFLRNHDEMGMGKLDDEQKQQVYQAFGPDSNMQLYNRGIRRRLAPMLGNNPARIKMAYSLLFSLPAVPMIRYGEELGMSEDLSLKERFATRTPMQWDSTANAGFSTNPNTIRPIVSDTVYGYKKLNVKAEKNDTLSLLTWVKKLAAARKKFPGIVYADGDFLNTGSPSVLGIKYQWNNQTLIVLNNLSEQPQRINLKEKDGMLDVLEPSKPKTNKGEMTIKPFGCLWLSYNIE